MSEISIRAARLDDAAALARLHVAVWRETYRDLAPKAAYQALDEGRRRAQWDGILAERDAGRVALIAETMANAEPAGFVLAGPGAVETFGGRGEVKFLYVDQRQKRRGIGRLLLAAVARHMAAAGHAGLALGVVAGNDAAIAFYERMGGRRIGAYTDPGPLWKSDNLVYAWDDLAALSAR